MSVLQGLPDEQMRNIPLTDGQDKEPDAGTAGNESKNHVHEETTFTPLVLMGDDAVSDDDREEPLPGLVPETMAGLNLVIKGGKIIPEQVAISGVCPGVTTSGLGTSSELGPLKLSILTSTKSRTNDLEVRTSGSGASCIISTENVTHANEIGTRLKEENTSCTQLNVCTNSDKGPYVCVNLQSVESENSQPEEKILYICKKCIFMSHSKLVFQTHLQTHTHTVGKPEENNTEALKGRIDKDKEGPHICVLCGEEFKTWEAVDAHLQTHNVVEPYTCSVCNMRFSTEYDRDAHSMAHQGEAEGKNPQCETVPLALSETGETPMKTYTLRKCSVCGKGYTKVEQSKMTHAPKDALEKCPDCVKEDTHKEFEPQLAANKHMLHQVPDVNECSHCSKRFFHPEHLRKHMRIHTGEKPHKCCVCSKRFAWLQHLASHMLTHKVKKLHTCTVCRKGFVWLQHLEKHMLTHIGKKLNKCTVCTKRFVSSSYLDTHMRTQHQEVPHKCSMCSASFAKYTNLKRHMTTVCSEKFRYSSNLKEHTKGKVQQYAVSSQGFSETEVSQRDMTTRTGEKLHQCTDCVKEFSSQSALKEHMANHKEKTLYTCSFCDEQFSTMLDVCNHMHTHKNKTFQPASSVLQKSLLNNVGGSALTTAENDEEKNKTCPVITVQDSQKAHMTRTDDTDSTTKPYNCSVCSASFVDESNLKVHMMTHTGEKPYRCPFCSSWYKKLSTLRTHVKMHVKRYLATSLTAVQNQLLETSSNMEPHFEHSEEGPFSCVFCNEEFVSKLAANKHMLHTAGSCQVPVVHECSHCSKTFTDQSNLNIHMRIHTGEKPHMCSDCGKQFTNAGSLKRHMMTHTGEKPHQCSDCGKQFTHASNLKIHMMTHTGEKPHKCSDCGKQFTLAGHLKIHMMTHTGEKPHKCSDCGKQFTLADHLKRHMMTHTGEKPHNCSDCGKQFTHASTLKIHMMTHTGEKPHKYSVCSKRFNRSSKLKVHMMRHTGEKPYP